METGVLTPPNEVNLTKIKTLSPYAFYHSKIAYVTAPSTGNKGLKSIGSHCFAQCTKLKVARIDHFTRLEDISQYAFGGCTAMTIACIPSSVKRIGDGAFENCSSLNEISDYHDDDYKGSNRVYDIFGVKTTIAQEITIGKAAFQNTNLKSICFANKANIGYCAFIGCPLEKALILDKESVLGKYSFGYESGSPKKVNKYLSMYGDQNVINYANANGILYATRWSDSHAPINYDKYRVDAPNRDFVFGKNGYYYLDPRHGTMAKRVFEGVCTGTSVISVLSYLSDKRATYFNIFTKVPDIKKADGTKAKYLSDINKDNINDEARSFFTACWQNGNGLYFQTSMNRNLLFRYCYLMNSGVVKPTAVYFESHVMVFYGAQHRDEEPNSKYWDWYEDGKLRCSFDERILVYDNSFQYFPDGTIDNAWGEEKPWKEWGHTYLYINSKTGQWCYREGQNYYISDTDKKEFDHDFTLLDTKDLLKMPIPASLR